MFFWMQKLNLFSSKFFFNNNLRRRCMSQNISEQSNKLIKHKILIFQNPLQKSRKRWWLFYQFPHHTIHSFKSTNFYKISIKIFFICMLINWSQKRFYFFLIKRKMSLQSSWNRNFLSIRAEIIMLHHHFQKFPQQQKMIISLNQLHTLDDIFCSHEIF